MTLTELLSFIDTNIGTKLGTDKITGAQHNAVLREVVASLIDISGTGFGGDIAPADNPGPQTQPIYFLASTVGTYTYCGGLQVTALPAFIIWSGTNWKLNQIGVPTTETTDTGLRGLARTGDAAPANPQLGDWYVYIDTATLSWPSALGITKPGIVRLASITPQRNWVLTAFGDEGGGTGNPNDKQFFATEALLRAAYPIGEEGWFALIGETDTFWTWDVEAEGGADWVNTNSRGTIEVDAIPTKNSNAAVASGGVYKTIKQTFVVESTSDSGVVSASEAFRVTSIVAETGLVVSVKYANGTDYVIGDPLPAFDKLYFTGDTLNKSFTVIGEIL